MRKMLVLFAVPVLAIALAASAVAFVPSVLNALSQGRTPSSMQTDAPSWKVGDTWTYNISLGSMGEGPILPQEMTGQTQPDISMVLGTLTQTVVGSVSTEYGSAWNVTEKVTFLVGHPTPIVGPDYILPPPFAPAVRVSGFEWYRQSDLAPVYSLESIHINRTWNLTVIPEAPAPGPDCTGTLPDASPSIALNGTYFMSYNATTQTWFHPALAVLQFPLAENSTYNVSSNATIQYWSSFRVVGPNVTYGTDHFATFTVPIDFSIRTGRFENVTTPAGTFRVLPISAYRKAFVPRISDPDASAVTNLTLATDCVTTPHAFATAWFSDQVGNVVKADFSLGGFEGPRMELTLVSYTYG